MSCQLYLTEMTEHLGKKYCCCDLNTDEQGTVDDADLMLLQSKPSHSLVCGEECICPDKSVHCWAFLITLVPF